MLLGMSQQMSAEYGVETVYSPPSPHRPTRTFFLCMSHCAIVMQASCSECKGRLCHDLQEERVAVSVQEGADLPLNHLRLDAPDQTSLWKEQYQVNISKCVLAPGIFA